MGGEQEGQIIILDDDDARRHDFQTILEFLGETVHALGFNEWQAVTRSKKILRPLLAILAPETGKSVSSSLLQQIRDYDSALPVMLVGTPDVAEEIPIELRQMVISQTLFPPGYSKLLDDLHRSRVYRDQQDFSSSRQRQLKLFRSLVGNSRPVQDVREMMTQVADSDVTVLVTGESGTGKEVVARNLHHHSNRRDQPFVPVNCGAIPAELLESELFGHEKGSFTGAVSSRVGRIELAQDGTLFLDEIGDMPLTMQVKLLRVLQERNFERVGGTENIQANIRVICATHRNLEAMIEDGSFREDLYYRINVFPIELPPLRERVEDIPILVNELVSRMESEDRGSVRFNSAAIMSLCRHDWAGNVRELANLVERMAILHPCGVVGVRDLPRKFRHVDEAEEESLEDLAEETAALRAAFVVQDNPALLPVNGLDLREHLSEIEKSLIEQAMQDCGGVVARAAERLHLRRTTLVEKMRKYGLMNREPESEN